MSIDTVTPHATVVGAAGAAANNLTVGVSANGMLTIQSGGAVSDVIGFIAGNSGSSGNPGLSAP